MVKLSLNMRNCQVLFLFLVLWKDGPDQVKAQIPVKAAKGENIKFYCGPFLQNGEKIFCKNSCNPGRILVKTSEDTGRNGRYSIDLKRGSSIIASYIMRVSITNVTRFDSGEYQCVMKHKSFHTFIIEVTDENQIFTLPPAITTHQSFTLNPVSFETFGPFEPKPTSKTDRIYLLLLFLILVVLAIVLVLIFYKKKKYQNDQETIGNSGTANTEVVTYENIHPPPASSQTDHTYQSLSPATTDHNQIY